MIVFYRRQRGGEERTMLRGGDFFGGWCKTLQKPQYCFDKEPKVRGSLGKRKINREGGRDREFKEDCWEERVNITTHLSSCQTGGQKADTSRHSQKQAVTKVRESL